MIAVIMAGGQGTRLKTYTEKLPKPMLPIDNKPVLMHQVEVLKRYGIVDIIMVVGYKGRIIKDFFKDGRDFGVYIRYIEEDTPLGTAGSFFYLQNYIHEDFLLLFGDIFFNIEVNKFVQFHYNKKSSITLLCHPNSHPYDSDLILIDQQDRVVGFESKNNQRDYFYKNCVNAGLYILSKDILKYVPQPKKTDLDKDIIFPFIKTKNNIFAYRTSEYVKDMGTEERFKQVELDYYKGIIQSRNLNYKQKCIFLDRDGTINKYKGFITNPAQIELEEGSASAIKQINQSSYLCIIISNQPVIARNLCSFEQLTEIHNKLETLLGQEGAYIDDLYYCPHHPDKGFPEENPLYKIDCACRKPKIGLIEESKKKYNIDVAQSYFIGDSTTDIKTAKNAGLSAVLVKTGEAGMDGKYQIKADFTYLNLIDAVNCILKYSIQDN